MSKTNEADLRKMDKEAQKLKRKLKRADLDYTVQISMNSSQPGEISYTLSMTAPAAGLAPIMFVTGSYERLVEYIQAAQKEFDAKTVERAYHEAQIAACERTIAGHRERLVDMEKEDEEEESDNGTEEEKTDR